MRRLYMLFLLPACMWAQTESSLTVTATRSLSVQPDQEVLSVTVTTPLSTGLDDVLTALTSVGVTTANLSGVYSETTGTSTVVLQWTFASPVPLATFKANVNSLAALQQSIGQQHSGWSLSYNSEQLQTSAAALAAQPCPTANLLADARAQAQNLVSASPALSVGPILALSDGTGSANSQVVSGRYSTFFVISGPFEAVYLTGLTTYLSAPVFVTNPTCTLAVKFALQRYQ